MKTWKSLRVTCTIDYRLRENQMDSPGSRGEDHIGVTRHSDRDYLTGLAGDQLQDPPIK